MKVSKIQYINNNNNNNNKFKYILTNSTISYDIKKSYKKLNVQYGRKSNTRRQNFTLFPSIVFDLYEPVHHCHGEICLCSTLSAECQCERHSSGLN